MNFRRDRLSPRDGTVDATYYEGHAHADGDERMNIRYYTYRTDAGLVAGATTSVMFAVDRPAKDVWRYLKDFNLWQNAYDHYYSGVVGDLEGLPVGGSDKPIDSPGELPYEVIRAIPEYLIVLAQPAPEQGAALEETGLPGLGSVSMGFHVFMLNEHEGKTVVTVFMEHGSYASRSPDTSIDEALRPWREMTPEWQMKWIDIFIPRLKDLVYNNT